MMQFTNKLAFSLSKKRLQMLHKSKFSLLTLPKVSVFLPLLCVLTFLFCDKIATDDSRTFVNGIEIKEVPTLHYYQLDGSTTDKPDRNHFNGLRAYTLEGKPFTGTQKTFNLTEDKLQSETIFNDGWAITSSLTEAIDDNAMIRMDFEYEPEQRMIQKAYNEHDVLMRKGEMLYSSNGTVQVIEKKIFNASNNIERHTVTKFENKVFRGLLEIKVNQDTVFHSYFEGDLYVIKDYHPNGRLKFKSAQSADGYEGFMTLYDEQGNITQQERYENGVLIETIK